MADYKKTNEDGTLYNVKSDNPIDNVITASTTLDASSSGQDILVGTDALTITLPAASTAGLRYTFINTGADNAVALTLSPAATDAIIGTIANAAADSVSSGVVNKDIVNTKATANKGDRISLISDGGTSWYIIGGVGIWASEG